MHYSQTVQQLQHTCNSYRSSFDLTVRLVVMWSLHGMEGYLWANLPLDRAAISVLCTSTMRLCSGERFHWGSSRVGPSHWHSAFCRQGTAGLWKLFLVGFLLGAKFRMRSGYNPDFSMSSLESCCIISCKSQLEPPTDFCCMSCDIPANCLQPET